MLQTYSRHQIVLLLLVVILFNRPGVAGAVLQTPLSPIHSVSDPFPPNLQATFNPKP